MVTDSSVLRPHRLLGAPAEPPERRKSCPGTPNIISIPHYRVRGLTREVACRTQRCCCAKRVCATRRPLAYHLALGRTHRGGLSASRGPGSLTGRSNSGWRNQARGAGVPVWRVVWGANGGRLRAEVRVGQTPACAARHPSRGLGGPGDVDRPGRHVVWAVRDGAGAVPRAAGIRPRVRGQLDGGCKSGLRAGIDAGCRGEPQAGRTAGDGAGFGSVGAWHPLVVPGRSGAHRPAIGVGLVAAAAGLGRAGALYGE